MPSCTESNINSIVEALTETVSKKAVPDEFANLAPAERKKAQNRRACQTNRRRRKEYVKHLEGRVEFLENEVTRLNKQVERYKIKQNLIIIGEEKDHSEFQETQEQSRTSTINMLKQNKSTENL